MSLETVELASQHLVRWECQAARPLGAILQKRSSFGSHGLRLTGFVFGLILIRLGAWFRWGVRVHSNISLGQKFLHDLLNVVHQLMRPAARFALIQRDMQIHEITRPGMPDPDGMAIAHRVDKLRRRLEFFRRRLLAVSSKPGWCAGQAGH